MREWGNNPVSYVDPDGQAISLAASMVIGAAAGGWGWGTYSANHRATPGGRCLLLLLEGQC